MGEILRYFYRPEESVGQLLLEKDRGKWKQGVLYWLMLVVLVGFATMATYRISGIGLTDILGAEFIEVIQSTFNQPLNEGSIWLACAMVVILQTLIVVALKFIVWSLVIYIAGIILGKKIPIYEAVLLSMFAMLTRVMAQLIMVIAVVIASVCPVNIINQMIVGIAMILEYWYLIILGIGMSYITRESFLKGALIIMAIQGIFLIVGSMVPWLQIILG